MQTLATNVLVELDGRRRVHLSRVGRHRRYLACEKEDGTIVLTPVDVFQASTAASPPANPAGNGNGGAPPGEPDSPPGPKISPARLSTRDQILAAVGAAGRNGIPAGDIVKQVDGTRSWTYVILAELLQDGDLAKTSDRRYVRVDV